MSTQSPSLRLDFNFSQAPDQRGVLTIKASSPLNRGVFIFNLIILSMVIPTIDWESGDLSRLYMALGFGVISTLLFAILSASGKKAFSGQLTIDGKSRRVQVLEGLTGLPWRELSLPEKGTLVVDTYHILGHKARKYSYFRLWIRPGDADRKDFEQLAQQVDDYKMQVSGKPPELPKDSIRLFVSDDDTPLRILAESIAKVMQWDIFDLSSMENVHRKAAELDQPFGRFAAVRPKAVSQAALPQGIRLKDDNTVVASPYKPRFRILMLFFSCLVALILSMFTMMAAQSVIGLLSPLVLLVLLFVSLNTVTEIAVEREGIRVTPKAFGSIGLGRTDFINWKELEEVKAKKMADERMHRLELVSDHQRILVNLHSREQAQWLISYLEQKVRG